MSLVYENETLNDPNGKPHAVLDVAQINYADELTAAYGVKTAPTFAFRGKKGQKIITMVGDNTETSFVCQGGEVVFVNRLPSGQMDIYVPRDKDGKPTGEQILQNDYKKISGGLDEPEGALFQPAAAPSPLLWEAIKKPTAIRDAYGPGNHVFLGIGATLKIAGSTVSGINKAAFDATWAVTDKNGNVRQPARPPTQDFYSPQNFLQVLHP